MSRILWGSMLLALGVACAAARADEAAPVRIVVHTDRPKQELLGFGAQLWDGDPGAYALFPSANMTWIRLNMRGVEFFDQADLPESDYYDYLRRTIEWDRVDYLRSIRDANALKLILVSFDAPPIWIDEQRRVQPEHAESYAALWTAAVRAYADRGLKPDYIEIFNEPDGPWSGGAAPDVYGQIASSIRARLDAAGLTDVLIVGPGISRIDPGDGDPWIDALDDAGRAAHAAWSVHGWEWRNQEDPAYVREQFQRAFLASVERADPKRTKPLMLTEFSTKATTFNGVAHASHETNYRDTAADTPEFAIRVFEHALSYMNLGAAVLIYWQAADQWWEEAAWGLARRVSDAYRTRPVYSALQGLFRELPAGTRVLEVEQPGHGVYAGAFQRADGARWVAAVNGGAAESDLVLETNPPTPARTLSGWRWRDGTWASVEVEANPADGWTIRMPPASAVLLRME